MTAKEYLSQYRYNKVAKTRIEEQIEIIKTQLESITPRYSLTAGVSGGTGKDTSDGITRLIELQKELIKIQYEIYVTLHSTIVFINNLSVNDEVKTTLHNRYIKCLSWKEIAECQYMSDRQVYKLHSEGLKKVKEVLKSVQLNAVTNVI